MAKSFPQKIAASLQGSRQIKASDVSLVGEFQLEAADDASKEPTILLMANTGKPMDLNGFEYPVVVDFKGASFDKARTPIIVDHNTDRRFGHAMERVVIAAGMKQHLGGKLFAGPLIAAVGVRSSDMEIAKGIVADAKKGFPFQVSIGARIKKGYHVPEGETAEVNGKTYSGPMIVASKTVIRELSITVLGADNDTSAVVTAKDDKENDMDFEAWLAEMGLTAAELSEAQLKKLKAKHKAEIEAASTDDDTDDDTDPPVRQKKIKAKKKTPGRTIRKRVPVPAGPDDDDDDDDDDEIDASDALNDINARVSENQLRIEGINEIAANMADDLEDAEFTVGRKKMTLKQFKAHAIKSNMSVDTFELQCRRASYPNLEAGFRPGIQSNDPTPNNAKALEVSILRACGVPMTGHNVKNDKKYGLENLYDAKTLEESHKRQYQIGASINRLLGLTIEAGGGHVSHLTDRGSLMTAAFKVWNQNLQANNFSGISVTNVLENVMHKAAYAAFNAVEVIWPFICARRPVNDFKVHSLYRLDPLGHFRKVATDGELKHVSMTDTKKTLQAETYGAMITIDRKTQRNDDLGMILDQARSIGSLGAQRVEEAVFVLLLSNPSSFFASGNGNLISSSSALSITSLQTAQQKFRDQLINGKPIAVSPRTLIVGTNQEVLANQLYNQANMMITTTADTAKFSNNPFAGRFVPHYSGYLNNTSITDQDGLAISGQSSTQWYLFADPNAPQGSALVIGFLDGRETPYFDEAATEFSIPGGIQMRAFFDFGVAMHITQLGFKSTGAT